MPLKRTSQLSVLATGHRYSDASWDESNGHVRKGSSQNESHGTLLCHGGRVVAGEACWGLVTSSWNAGT